jgi:tetratricopeptide (TPR) repeat protein
MRGFLAKLTGLLGLSPGAPSPQGRSLPDDLPRRVTGPPSPAPADADPPGLPYAIHEEVTRLSADGDLLAEEGEYGEAVAKYIEALELVPEPRTEWEASTWLLTAIGDACFLAGGYPQARNALSDAMLCPGAIGNPFIHLRLGQAQLKLGNEERAADELARAYLKEGVAIFEDEDPKYLAFVKSKLAPPPGGWPTGW